MKNTMTRDEFIREMQNLRPTQLSAEALGAIFDYYLAAGLHAPATALEMLARDEFSSARYAVARNLYTPAEILAELANSRDFVLRHTLARNLYAPPEVLERLAKDEEPAVCEAVAANPNAPVPVLSQLRAHNSWNVRASVACNPTTPANILETLASDEHSNVRLMVATNPRTPASALEKLANDWVAWVVDAVLRNPSTPTSVLGRFSADTTKQPADKIENCSRESMSNKKINFSARVSAAGGVIVTAELFGFYGCCASESDAPHEAAKKFSNQLASGQIIVGELATLLDRAKLDLFSEIEDTLHRAEQAMILISEIRAAERERANKNGEIENRNDSDNHDQQLFYHNMRKTYENPKN